MKAFLSTAGVVFGLLVLVHAVRIAVEPEIARSPWFWLITLVAGALAVWAFRLLRRLPEP